MDPRIRILTKMSWITNTALSFSNPILDLLAACPLGLGRIWDSLIGGEAYLMQWMCRQPAFFSMGEWQVGQRLRFSLSFSIHTYTHAHIRHNLEESRHTRVSKKNMMGEKSKRVASSPTHSIPPNICTNKYVAKRTRRKRTPYTYFTKIWWSLNSRNYHLDYIPSRNGCHPSCRPGRTRKSSRCDTGIRSSCTVNRKLRNT